jgi:hypothetical protein
MTQGAVRDAAYRLEFEDTFDGSTLDRGRWLPYYLPHWSTRERAAARYTLADGLRLRIDEEQPPWCPEFDGDVRVSSIQTGAFAGPVGSAVGQHRFNPQAVVRQAQPNVRLYTPRYGLVEMRARFPSDPHTMIALWMIGYEDRPERSAEICVCEIFGRNVEAHRARIGMGVHPFGDPRLHDDFTAELVPTDVRDFHVCAAEWTPQRVVWSIDGRVLKTVQQSPDYAMQLMLGIYEFRNASNASETTYPKEFVVDYIRGYTSSGH